MDDNINKALVFGSQIIAVILVVVGNYLQKTGLHSPRPPGSGVAAVAVAGDAERFRFARLWDDPLETIQRFPPPVAGKGNEGWSWRANGYGFDGEPQPGLVLWNMIDSRPTVDAREARIRARYALVTTLAASGYLPETDSALLAIVKEPVGAGGSGTTRPEAEHPNSGSSRDDDPFRNVVAYWELFRLDKESGSLSHQKEKEELAALPQLIVVAWVPDTLSSGVPSKADVLGTFGVQQVAAAETPRVHVIHHGSSTRFRRIVEEEYPDSRRSDPGEGEARVHFVKATVPSDTFPPEQRGLAELMQSVVSDDVLMESLHRELELRIPGLNADPPRGRIVIYTESDGTYGRTLVDSLGKNLPEGFEPEVYTYLRGLDGRAGERPESVSQQSAPGASLSGILSSAEYSDPSWGTSQFDYLRRSASRLADSTASDGPVVAVGVLGSDVYDKLIVLQAVHPELPSAVYFTTDLDALFFAGKNVPFTRNLVVASGEGLVCGHDFNWAMEIPPMRDSYQTALAHLVSGILKRENLHAERGHAPSVVEIGAGEAIELQEPGDCAISALCGNLMLRWGAAGWFNPLTFFAGLANALLILLLVSSYRWKEHRDDRGDEGAGQITRSGITGKAARRLKAEAWTAGLLAIGLFFALLVSTVHPAFGDWFVEPMRATAGVSVWPSVFLRAGAFLVGMLLLWFTSKAFYNRGAPALEKLKKVLSEGAAPLPAPGPTGADGGRMGKCLAWFDRTAEKAFGKRLVERYGLEAEAAGQAIPSAGDVDASQSKASPDRDPNSRLPLFVRRCTDPVRRFRRVALASCIYFLISLFIFWLWQPVVPVRGAFAFLVEKVTLSASVGLYIVHLCFCVELHVCCYRLIDWVVSVVGPPGDGEGAEAGGWKPRYSLEQLKTIASELGKLTTIVGLTLLYPLTILSLLLLSRLRLFDDWTMTPSLGITFGGGAIILVAVAVLLLAGGRKLRIAIHDASKRVVWNEEEKRVRAEKSAAKNEVDKKALEAKALVEKAKKLAEEASALRDGALAPWYKQPIFTAIFAALAIFGSLGLADSVTAMLVR